AVLEPAVTILVLAAGRLHHPVQGDELRDDEFSHDCPTPFSAYDFAASTRYQVKREMVQGVVRDTAAASAETESGLSRNVVPKRAAIGTARPWRVRARRVGVLADSLGLPRC